MIDWYEAYIVVFYDYIHHTVQYQNSINLYMYIYFILIYSLLYANIGNFPFWSNLIQISQHMWIKKSFHVKYTSSKVHSHLRFFSLFPLFCVWCSTFSYWVGEWGKWSQRDFCPRDVPSFIYLILWVEDWGRYMEIFKEIEIKWTWTFKIFCGNFRIEEFKLDF